MGRHSFSRSAAARRLGFVVALLFLTGRVAVAQEPGVVPSGPALTADPVLAALVREALETRPELAQARASIQADLERVPQARALPDPVVSLGIQNDGFRRIEIGEMESSWLLFMASQTLPWRGKRGLRGDLIALEVQRSEADVARMLLSVRAEVERTYVDLLLVRDQLGLLDKLDALWTQTEGIARVRYEVGDGSQSDVIRAQLEQSRLKQRRWALEDEERRRVIVMNRLRGRAPGDAVATSRSLVDIPDPVVPGMESALEDAQAKSPELQKSRLAIEQSASLVELAGKDYYPDVTVSAGLMPRGGPFPPMWQAGVSFSIPIWGGSKQARAVEENRIRGTSARFGAEAIEQVLRQRIAERLSLLNALAEINHLYRSGLLVQSEATAQSTMAQYQVGRVPFASVLEALNGYVADLDAYYVSVAVAQRVDIAQREISLESPAGGASGGMSGSSVPGAGSMTGGDSPSQSAPPPPSAGSAGSGSMKRM